MNHSKNEVCFNAERAATDSSLVAERTRTTHSLLHARVRAEGLTDARTQVDRHDADTKLEASRLAFDSSTGRGGFTGDLAFPVAPVAPSRSDEQLIVERKNSDRALESERVAVDAAIDHERGLKRGLAQELSRQERGLTDSSLASERVKTDTEFAHASLRFDSEVTDHGVTRNSLTTRDEFLAIASHDLRNPIGAVSGCAEMLLGHWDSTSLDEIRHWVGFMKRNADKGLRLISDLLDVERIGQGKFEVALRPTAIRPIFNEAVESTLMAAKAKGVELSMRSSSDESVMADGHRLLQVLTNLLGNAIKFTPSGGSVSLTSEVFGEEIEMAVVDTGCGIDPEHFQSIFEKLTQLKSLDRTGLGLGLYIAKTIIAAHGSQIAVKSDVEADVKSAVGTGSRFSFRLPRVSRA